MIQVRVPKGLLRMIDELKKRGIYRSRSEAVVDGLRHVVLKYRFVGGLGYLYALYRRGLIKRDLSFDDLPVTPPEEAEKVKEVFEGLSVEEVMDIVRRRGRGRH